MKQHKTGKFFIIIEGKEVPFKFEPGRFEQYREISERLWGGLPLDVTWAMNTQIYKDDILRLERQKEEVKTFYSDSFK